jgi:lipopolysaccharide assembly outer membrane protein LptD (OstA)
MRRYNKLIICILAACLAVLGVAMSIGAPDAAKPDAPKKPKETVNIDGDKWKWRSEGDSSVYSITGHVIIKHGDTTVTADKAEYNEKTRIAVVESNVKIVDGRNEITGQKATTYLNDRRNVIEGGVKLIGIPKPDTSAKKPDSVGAKLSEPTTLVCDKLEYLYKKKIATAEGSLKITQKGRMLVGNRAVYDANLELVTLFGGVKVTDEKGQTFSSPGEVKVSLKDGSEWIESGTGSASLNFDIDEELESDKTPEKKE